MLEQLGRRGDRRCRRSRSSRPKARSTTRAKYLAKSTQEICPGRFSPEISAQLMDQALRAHRALSCSGYSRTDFIVSDKGPVYLETNTLPGLTKASLYPEGAQGAGHRIRRFPARPDRAGGEARSQVVNDCAGSACGREPVELRDIGKIFTNFAAKYSQGGSKRALPAPALPFVYQEVRRLTLAAHVALGCRGVSCCGFPLRRPHRGNR